MTALSETKRYQAYPEYKDSGVEWLENIPSHWETKPLKHLCSFNDDVLAENTKKDYELCYVDIGSVSATDGISRVETMTYGSAPSRARRLVRDGDVIVSTVRTYLEAIAPINNPPSNMVVSTGFAVIRPNNKLYKGYAAYCLRANGFIKEVVARSVGVSYPAINATELVGIAVPSLPIEEQTQIANFLDHETAKIDRLIEKQQQLIKLLKEKRQAVISHAVTKGLNPQAPMKDSGVEWLGDVPEHWEQIKLKHITHQIVDAEHKTAPYFDDGEYLVCRTTNVRDGKLRLDGGKYTNHAIYEEWTKRGQPEVGDILFTREAPAGEACVYTGEVPLCLGQRMVLFKLNQTRVLPEFVLHSIYSGLADDFVKQLSQGSTVAHFNMSDIQNIPLFEPPKDEQARIIDHLAKVLAKYDALTSSASLKIELMQERRTALISAAVTGKIDVRNWLAPTSQDQALEQTA
ncbi:TPA: restriction endonuclease subunit S [Vibrio parahaemolyticus]|nr:restriction endonuclease subunit S [Vibrio parahaemolyticus]HCH0841298.1 restriction endonuclease subunit S [Vibrio parahaemolyticus]